MATEAVRVRGSRWLQGRGRYRGTSRTARRPGRLDASARSAGATGSAGRGAEEATVTLGDRWPARRARRRGPCSSFPGLGRGWRTGACCWDPRVQDLVRFVEAERGLTFEHPVPVDFLTPEQFRDELTTEAADITRRTGASSGPPRRSCAPSACSTGISTFWTSSTRSRPKGSLPSTTPRGSGCSSPTDRSRLRYGRRSPTSSRMRSRTSTTT